MQDLIDKLDKKLRDQRIFFNNQDLKLIIEYQNRLEEMMERLIEVKNPYANILQVQTIMEDDKTARIEELEARLEKHSIHANRMKQSMLTDQPNLIHFLQNENKELKVLLKSAKKILIQVQNRQSIVEKITNEC